MVPLDDLTAFSYSPFVVTMLVLEFVQHALNESSHNISPFFPLLQLSPRFAASIPFLQQTQQVDFISPPKPEALLHFAPFLKKPNHFYAVLGF